MNYYVADADSYRLVPHEKIITVYQEKDVPLLASFVKSFKFDNEVKNQEIRYFFPEGCELLEDCAGKCCQNRAEIFFPVNDKCCKQIAQLSIPINFSSIENVPLDDINKINSEVDPVAMLSKLLKLVEKSKDEEVV